MHFVYILYSPAFDKFYVGESVNPKGRLSLHLTGFYPASSTKFTNDWQLKSVFKVGNRKQALIIERYIKSMKSKKFIRTLVDDLQFHRQFIETIRTKFSIQIL